MHLVKQKCFIYIYELNEREKFYLIYTINDIYDTIKQLRFDLLNLSNGRFFKIIFTSLIKRRKKKKTIHTFDLEICII